PAALRGGIHRVLSCPSSCLRAPIPCPGSSVEASVDSGTAAPSGSPRLSGLSRDRGSNCQWCVRKTALSVRPDLRTSAPAGVHRRLPTPLRSFADRTISAYSEKRSSSRPLFQGACMSALCDASSRSEFERHRTGTSHPPPEELMHRAP